MSKLRYIQHNTVYLNPTKKEKAYIDTTVDMCIFIHNTFLKEMQDRWDSSRIKAPTSRIEYSNMLTDFKRNNPDSLLHAVSSTAVRNATWDLMAKMNSFLFHQTPYPIMLNPHRGGKFRLNNEAFKISEVDVESIIPQNSHYFGLNKEGIYIPELRTKGTFLHGLEFCRTDDQTYQVDLLRGIEI